MLSRRGQARVWLNKERARVQGSVLPQISCMYIVYRIRKWQLLELIMTLTLGFGKMFFFFLFLLVSELLVIPWLRTSGVFTCSCKRRASIATTSLEKYGSRALQKRDSGRVLLSPVLNFYSHSSAKQCRVMYIFAPSKARCVVKKKCRTWLYWPGDAFVPVVWELLFTHTVYLFYIYTMYNFLGCLCVCTHNYYYMIISERCSTKQRGLAYVFVL